MHGRCWIFTLTSAAASAPIFRHGQRPDPRPGLGVCQRHGFRALRHRLRRLRAPHRVHVLRRLLTPMKSETVTPTVSDFRRSTPQESVIAVR